MKLQVLVSTMNQVEKSIIDSMNIVTDAVIINQCAKEEYEEIVFKGNRIDWIDSNEKGLSKSRNKAIKKAKEEICLLADDDLEYIPNYERVVLESFSKFPKADIIAFQVHGIEKEFKQYSATVKKIGFLSAMKIASVEIAFRTKSIKEADIHFDELFGSGSEYFMGEESIFLYDCLKKNLNIVYVPLKIADLHMGESTWFNGFNKMYFLSKGAAYTRMSKKYCLILILQFAVRKYKLYSDEVKIMQSIKYMLEGRRSYLKSNSK